MYPLGLVSKHGGSSSVATTITTTMTAAITAPTGSHTVSGRDGCGSRRRESDELRLSEHDESNRDGGDWHGAGEMRTAGAAQRRDVLKPTATKVVCCAIVVAFATMEIALASARGTG